MLFQILTIQSALPFLVLLGISIYILGALDIINDPAMEVTTFIVSLSLIFSF